MEFKARKWNLGLEKVFKLSDDSLNSKTRFVKKKNKATKSIS